MLPAVISSSPGDTPSSRLSAVARGLLYSTALVPIVVVPGFFFPYVTTRAVYFRVLVQLATAVLLYLSVRRRATVSFRRDVVLFALVAWVGANALAAVFGASPIRSFFGDHERMGGVWFWLHLVAYYVLLRTFFESAHWAVFFRLHLAVATIVAMCGMVVARLQPFSRFVAPIEAGSTIGNAGLLAPYLLAALALCVILAITAGKRARVAYFAIGLVLVTGIVLSGNRSSTLGLLVGAGSAVACYALWLGRLQGWRIALVVAPLAAAVALPFLAGAPWAKPVTSRVYVLSKLSSGVDSIRVIQWHAAVEGIRDRPLMGVGPENYQIVWSRFYHPEMYRFIADSRWDRAHNAYLDAFSTAGILGFLSLLAVFLALGWSAWQAARAGVHRADQMVTARQPAAGVAVALGFSVAYAFFLAFWFFDLNSTMLWIALGAFVASRASGEPLFTFGPALARRWQSTMVLALGAVALAGVLYVHGFETLRMARNLDRVRDPRLSQEEILQRYRSVFASPAPVTQHVFVMYAANLASMRPRFQEIRANAVSGALFDRAFILAIEEFERQAVRDPYNERVSVQHARVLILGAYYYDNIRLYESALRRLERAVELAPRRVPTRLSLGMAYLNIQRPREALVEFDTAYTLYPPHGQTAAYIGLAHASLKENRQAVAWLKRAVAAGYELDRAILTRVLSGIANSGEPALGADYISYFLISKYGPASMWELASGGDAEDYRLAIFASDLFLRGGEVAKATDLASAAARLCERTVPLPTLARSALRADSVPVPDCRQPWRRNAA